MEKCSSFKNNLTFWVGSLLLWQFITIFSPSPLIRWISFFLCLVDLILFLWLIHPQTSSALFKKTRVKAGFILLLIAQFSLSLPIQTSDWQFIQDQSYTLSEEDLTTCFKSTSHPAFYQFNCELDGTKIEFDLPKHELTLNIQTEKTGISYYQRYTYTLLEWLMGLSKNNESILFQQSHFVLDLSPTLVKILNIEN